MAGKTKSVKDFHCDHGEFCWMCSSFLRRMQISQMELHHIAGRGRQHDVRANYAALCRRCHQAIQSLQESELVCLVLKRLFDAEHYDRALICELRGWATSAITDTDVNRCERIMRIMKEVS